LVARDIKLRYKRSVIGFAWSLLNPLAQLLVFGFVFTTVLPLDIPNYTVFLFSGLLPWTWFSGALYEAANAVVESRELIRRPGFPTAVLPVVTVMSHLVHFVLALPVLLLFLWAAAIPFTWAILALPLVIVLLLGFYLTPVFYDSAAIPQKFYLIYLLNPMCHFVNAYRAILLQGLWPDFFSLILVGSAASVLLLLGYQYFIRTSCQFVEEL
jgi:lipopolysaccharide transport system permease protein